MCCYHYTLAKYSHNGSPVATVCTVTHNTHKSTHTHACTPTHTLANITMCVCTALAGEQHHFQAEIMFSPAEYLPRTLICVCACVYVCQSFLDPTRFKNPILLAPYTGKKYVSFFKSLKKEFEFGVGFLYNDSIFMVFLNFKNKLIFCYLIATNIKTIKPVIPVQNRFYLP